MRPHPRRPAVDERRAPPHVHLSTPARGVQVPLAFPTENRFSVAVFCGCAGRFTARKTVVAGPGSLLLLQDVFPLCRGDLRHPGSWLSARGPERKTLMRRRRCHLRSGSFPRRRSVEHGRVADTGPEYEATVLGAKQYSTGSATLSLFFIFCAAESMLAMRACHPRRPSRLSHRVAPGTSVGVSHGPPQAL
jgi:hypothetical protein